MVDFQTAAVLDRPIKSPGRQRHHYPSAVQRAWLIRGLTQAGGKLPLFDAQGQFYNPRTIQSCVERGWAEPWTANPIKPDWRVCKLTEAGRDAVS